MAAVQYGSADLLLRVRRDASISKQIGRAVVLSGTPRHLRLRPRIWLTAGNCQETLGFFDLDGHPRTAPGTLSFPGKNPPRRDNATWLDVQPGTLTELRQPIAYETAAGRPRVHGSFVYARSESKQIVVLHNPEAKPGTPTGITTRLAGEGRRHPLDFEEVPAREALRNSAEHKLIEAYKQALGPSPRRWAQWVFAVDNRSGMTSDLWDKNLGVLIEAKGSAERAAVRMAIGQLLDYRHALAEFNACTTQPKGDPLRSSPLLAVLLPCRPDADVLSLLEAVKIACIWKEGRTFEDNAAGLFTQSGTPTRRRFRASRWSGL